MIILHKYPFSSSFFLHHRTFCRRRQHSPIFSSNPSSTNSSSECMCSYHDHKFQFKYWFHCCCPIVSISCYRDCKQHRSHSISHSIRNGQNYHIHSCAMHCAVCASVIFIQRKLNYFLRLHLSLNFVVRFLRSLHTGSVNAHPYGNVWTSIWTSFQQENTFSRIFTSGCDTFELWGCIESRRRRRCVCVCVWRVPSNLGESLPLEIYVNSM